MAEKQTITETITEGSVTTTYHGESDPGRKVTDPSWMISKTVSDETNPLDKVVTKSFPVKTGGQERRIGNPSDGYEFPWSERANLHYSLSRVSLPSASIQYSTDLGVTIHDTVTAAAGQSLRVRATFSEALPSDRQVYFSVMDGDQEIVSPVLMGTPFPNDLRIRGIQFTAPVHVTENATVVLTFAFQGESSGIPVRTAWLPFTIRLPVITEAHGGTYDAFTMTYASSVGGLVEFAAADKIVSVNRVSSSTATKAYVHAYPSGTLLGTATFSGDVATFATPISVSAGQYAVTIGSDGASFDSRNVHHAPFPISGTRLNWINGFYGTNVDVEFPGVESITIGG